MANIGGSRARRLHAAWEFAQRRPRLTVYSLIGLVFIVWAVSFKVSVDRSEAARQAFENSPEGRAQAAAQERAMSDDQEIEMAQMFVTTRLRDPESARFSGVHMMRRGGEKGVCGFVNAKNGFGGMAGNEAFAMIDMEVIMANSAAPKKLQRLNRLCYGR